VKVYVIHRSDNHGVDGGDGRVVDVTRDPAEARGIVQKEIDDTNLTFTEEKEGSWEGGESWNWLVTIDILEYEV